MPGRGSSHAPYRRRRPRAAEVLEAPAIRPPPASDLPVGREALTISGHPNPSPERLHRFHRDLRRLRVQLRLLGHLLGAPDRLRAQEVGRRMKRVARLVGEVRDFDVELALLSHPRLARLSRSSSEHFERTRGRLREEARTGRALLGAFLRAELDRGLIRDLEHVLGAGEARRSTKGLEQAASFERERSQSRTERALRRARKRPTPKRMHQLRSALRQAHHVHDVLAPPGHGTRHPFPQRLERLQQALGRLHDLDVLADGLESLGPEVWRSAWAKFERRRRRDLRTEISSELRRRSVRAQVANLVD